MNIFILHCQYFWLILALLFLVFEIGHPGLFYFLSFAIGAVGAAVTSSYGYPLVTQLLSFVITTIIALGILKWWVSHRLFKGREHVRTNVYALQGKSAIVTKKITPENPGEVKVNGELWMARSSETIEQGKKVKIDHVRGAHVIVSQIAHSKS